MTGLPLLLVNSMLYLATLLTLPLLLAEQLSLIWLGVGFAYSSMVEYLIHRILLHSGFRILSDRHGIHHQTFRASRLWYVNRSQWHLILFSPTTTIAILLIAIGHYAFFRFVGFAALGYCFAIALILYFLCYEWLHLTIHARIHIIQGWPIFRWLRHHHLIHHSARRKTGNFNVLLPLSDGMLSLIKRAGMSEKD